MYVEDYIKRMIAIAAAMIARIMGLKASGDYQQARVVIDQLLELVVGLKADLVRRLDDDSLLETLTRQARLDTDRLWLLAELFKQDGDVLTLQGHATESRTSYLRALNLYLEVVLSGGAPNYPEPHEIIGYLVRMLPAHMLPAETLYTLFNYYEQTGRYAQAEETLGRLLAATELKNEIEDEYRAFYRRLLEVTDAALQQGGMRRAQVEASLARLEGE